MSRALPSERRNDKLTANCLEAFLREYNLNWDLNTKLYDGVPELRESGAVEVIDTPKELLKFVN